MGIPRLGQHSTEPHVPQRDFWLVRLVVPVVDTKLSLLYAAVFLQNSHGEDCLRKSLMLVLAVLLRGHFLESRGNSYLNFVQPHAQLYGVKFKNGRFQQSLPLRISELRIHSPSLVRVRGRRPSATRLAQFGTGVSQENVKKMSRKHRGNVKKMSRKHQESYCLFLFYWAGKSGVALDEGPRIALISSFARRPRPVLRRRARVDRPKDQTCEVVVKPGVRNSNSSSIRVKMI